MQKCLQQAIYLAGFILKTSVSWSLETTKQTPIYRTGTDYCGCAGLGDSTGSTGSH